MLFFGLFYAGDCNFDSGMCTWSNDKSGDDFDWVRQQGGDSNNPPTDHTTGTGKGKTKQMKEKKEKDKLAKSINDFRLGGYDYIK